MSQQHKALSRVEIKDADRGEIAAVFSTFDVIDKDGDVTLKEAFTDGAPVAISAYGHQSWKGALPVGKGRIRVGDNEAVMEGRFFMDTTHGADTFRTVKALSDEDGPGQEWSYSLRNIVAERGTWDGQNVRILKSITVHEVSPVMVGAGVDTRTLAVKGAKQLASDLNARLRSAGQERFADDEVYVWVDDYDLDEQWAVFCVCADGEDRYVQVAYDRDDDGMVTLGDEETEVVRTSDYAPKGARFTEHCESVLADLRTLNARARQVVALRAAKGKSLAVDSGDLLVAVDAGVKQFAELMHAIRDEPTHTTDDDFRREYARFVALTTGATT